MTAKRPVPVDHGTTGVAEAEHGNQETAPSRRRIKDVKGNYFNGLERTQHDYPHAPKSPTERKVDHASLINETIKNSSTLNKMVTTADLLSEICVRESIPEDRHAMFKQGVAQAIREAKLDTKPSNEPTHFSDSFDKEAILRIIDESTLGKLHKKYEFLRRSKLPVDFIQTPEQLKVVQSITNTYQSLQTMRKKLQLEPLSTDPTISKAWKLLRAYTRDKEPTRSRDSVRRKRLAAPHAA